MQSHLFTQYLPYMLLKHFNRRQNQATFVVICALRVKLHVQYFLATLFRLPGYVDLDVSLLFSCNKNQITSRTQESFKMALT